MSGLDLFADWIPAINEKKSDIFKDSQIDRQSLENSYPSFMINRALSQTQDTIIQANEVNIRANWMPPEWQFHFLYETVTKKRRFAKWAKSEKSADIDLIKKVYKYNQQKAELALTMLSEQDLENLREWSYEGGRTK